MWWSVCITCSFQWVQGVYCSGSGGWAVGVWGVCLGYVAVHAVADLIAPHRDYLFVRAAHRDYLEQSAFGSRSSPGLWSRLACNWLWIWAGNQGWLSGLSWGFVSKGMDKAHPHHAAVKEVVTSALEVWKLGHCGEVSGSQAQAWVRHGEMYCKSGLEMWREEEKQKCNC